MNFTPDEQQTFALEAGDVLITEGCGSLSQLGASAQWNGDLSETVCFQNTLLRLRAMEGLTLPDFLSVWANFAFASGLFAAIASGTNIFHIGARRATELPIAVPPLEEQRRIVDFTDAVGGLETSAIAAAKECDALLLQLTESVFTRLSQDVDHRPIGQLVRRERRPVGVQSGHSYRQIGIRSHGKGIFHKEPVLGSDIGSKKLFWGSTWRPGVQHCVRLGGRHCNRERCRERHVRFPPLSDISGRSRGSGSVSTSLLPDETWAKNACRCFSGLCWTKPDVESIGAPFVPCTRSLLC